MPAVGCQLRVSPETFGCKYSGSAYRNSLIQISVGTAVEHHVLYQYQLVNTKNIFMGFIQTETP